MHVKRKIYIPVYIEPSSWRWSFGFEICRRQKFNIKIFIYRRCILLVDMA